MVDPYALPDGTLRNLLRIEDDESLARAEADITGAKLVYLSVHPLRGKYDFDHLRSFHRYIFAEIYEWAGELRTVEITKYDAFCRAMYLDAYAAEVFEKLALADLLRGRRRSEFIEGLAETYADINALHPFREGNGRTQRAFLRQLAHDAGYGLSWASLDAVRNERASIAGFRGDLGPLVDLLDTLVERSD